MRKRLAVFGFLSLLVSCAMAQAKGDWSDVKRIDLDQLITVKTRGTVRCTFFYATNDKLICNEEHAFGATERREIDRKDIREVHLELANAYNVAVNASIGAAAGVTAGAIANAANPHSGTDERFFPGLIGLLVGGYSGHKYHIVHGRVVYRR